MKKILLLILLTFFWKVSMFGAYLKNVPVTITQPNGKKIECFATGDEFYNWLHDSTGFTIIQNKITGYYCYAILQRDSLVASQYIVGTVSPVSVDLQPNLNISGEKVIEKVKKSFLYMSQREDVLQSGQQAKSGISGTINNIVIYIRFADDPEFPAQQSIYTNMFNSTISGANSMRNYFQEATYGQLDIVSHFYPLNDGVNILSYQDEHYRNYYLSYNDITNPIGYINDVQRWNREHVLFYNAVNYIKNQISGSLNIDYNNDDYIDNISFIIKGATADGLLWPHMTVFPCHYLVNLPPWTRVDTCIKINGKRAYEYNVQLGDWLVSSQSQPTGTDVLCHEMYHTLGNAPDLYHRKGDSDPVGHWDNMANNKNPPPHMGAYMKYKYGGWISSIPEIIASGTYTLQPLTSSVNNCYKVSIKNSSQFIVLEYRKKAGTFESSLPGSGLIIYRINEERYGNVGAEGHGGINDLIYIFRPNGTISTQGNSNNAYFSQTAGRTEFSNSTNPYSFTAPNGDYADICIKNIRENSNGTLSFDVRFCDYYNITYSNTNILPALTTTCGSIQISGTVIKSTDNIIFEAGNEVILDSGFEIKSGGAFEININTSINNNCED